MEEQRRFRLEGWVALAAGLVWWAAGAELGGLGLLLAALPAAPLLAGAVFGLLLLGGRWVPAATVFGGLLGVLLAPAFGFALGSSWAVGLLFFSAAGFVAGGGQSLWRGLRVAEAPAPIPTLRLRAELALDEALTAQFLTSVRFPSGEQGSRLAREVDEALELFEARGWLDDIHAYHDAGGTPDAPKEVSLRPAQVRSTHYEHLSFASEYAPQPEEPGRDRWLAHEPNRTAHAWVVRHREPRPWLMCVHGYGMGFPILDLGAFDPSYYHEKLGLNLIVPTLPFHGKRSVRMRSGRGFLEEPLDTVHAMANAVWDLRRCVSWVREQGGERIGIYGLSMGGYTTALTAALVDGFECAIAGIPVSDWSKILWYHAPPDVRRELEYRGVDDAKLHTLDRVISPLESAPRPDRERLAILAGVVDRIVPPEHAQALIDHWQPGRVEWFQGAHISTAARPSFRRAVTETLQATGLVDR